MPSYSLTVMGVTWSRKSNGGAAGLQRLLAQPTGKVLIAVRLMVLPGAFTHMPK